MLTETSRHAGHADILREQLDGSTGAAAEYADPQRDKGFWEARRAMIERAAQAAVEPDHDGSPHGLRRRLTSHYRPAPSGQSPANHDPFTNPLGSAMD